MLVRNVAGVGDSWCVRLATGWVFPLPCIPLNQFQPADNSFKWGYKTTPVMKCWHLTFKWLFTCLQNRKHWPGYGATSFCELNTWKCALYWLNCIIPFRLAPSSFYIILYRVHKIEKGFYVVVFYLLLAPSVKPDELAVKSSTHKAEARTWMAGFSTELPYFPLKTSKKPQQQQHPFAFLFPNRACVCYHLLVYSKKEISHPNSNYLQCGNRKRGKW